jgi:hypothetical protein
MIEKIVSSGRQGAERAALDVAVRWQFPRGGWCPMGSAIAQGIPLLFHLSETPSPGRCQALEWNVRDSDATVLFTISRGLFGHDAQAVDIARQHRKPFLHLPAHGVFDLNLTAEKLQHFLEENAVRTLHVTGSSPIREPDVWRWTFVLLETALFWDQAHPNTLCGSLRVMSSLNNSFR